MASAFAYTPPGEMFQQARWYRQRVAQIIDGRKFTLREGRELSCSAGWLSIILGWLGHDLGDSLTGEAYCLDAWEHGWQAEHGEVCAWAMDAAATIAMYSNRPKAARDAALKGLSQASMNSAASVRVACQLTRAYARLGQPDDFRDALSDTQRQIDGLPELGLGLFSAGREDARCAARSYWPACSSGMMVKPLWRLPRGHPGIPEPHGGRCVWRVRRRASPRRGRSLAACGTRPVTTAARCRQRRTRPRVRRHEPGTWLGRCGPAWE